MKLSLREKLASRENFFKKTRDFFELRGVIEVDTSLIRSYTVTDPYMSAYQVINPQGKLFGYLQTSPEYAMKKLLCEGAGDIFQLSKMFRANENSPIHAPEFTLLEWYRIGFDHHQLIYEVCELIDLLTGVQKTHLMTYQQAFEQCMGIDPFTISYQELKLKCEKLMGEIPDNLLFDNLLTLLFAEQVETKFDPNKITIIENFPASQSSLARTRIVDGIEVAERFEIYLAGVELANGFNELTDAERQLERFKHDNKTRLQLGRPEVAIDMELIDALRIGLPSCAGVALGIDRLLMIAMNHQSIDNVIVS